MVEGTVDAQGNPTANPDALGAGAGPQGGDDNLTWFDRLPDEIKKDASIQSFKGKEVNDVVKSYVEAQKLIGGSIRIPKADAKPEEWNSFWEKMGRPKTPEEYGIVKPAILPDGVEWKEDLAKEFSSLSHSLGLNKVQAGKLSAWYIDKISSDAQQNNQKLAERVEFGKSEAKKEIEKEWGPDYQRRITVARRGLKALGDEGLVELLDTSGLGNHPSFLKLFYSLGQKYAEDGMIDGSVEGAISPDEAKKRIQEIRNDPEHLYHPRNSAKPGHKEAIAEMEMLHKVAYGI